MAENAKKHKNSEKCKKSRNSCENNNSLCESLDSCFDIVIHWNLSKWRYWFFRATIFKITCDLGTKFPSAMKFGSQFVCHRKKPTYFLILTVVVVGRKDWYVRLKMLHCIENSRISLRRSLTIILDGWRMLLYVVLWCLFKTVMSIYKTVASETFFLPLKIFRSTVKKINIIP